MMCSNTACKGQTRCYVVTLYAGSGGGFWPPEICGFWPPEMHRASGICFPKAIISSTSITKELPYMFSSSQNGLQRATLFYFLVVFLASISASGTVFKPFPTQCNHMLGHLCGPCGLRQFIGATTTGPAGKGVESGEQAFVSANVHNLSD